MRHGVDDGLRLLSLEKLGPLGHALAREVLETGSLEVEPNVVAWQGSFGPVHGHLVVVWVDPELALRVRDAPAVHDALTAAVAAAVAMVSGQSLSELRVVGRESRPRASPYRGDVHE